MCDIDARVTSGGALSAIVVKLCAARDDLDRLLARNEHVVSPAELEGNRVFANCVRSFAASTHAIVELNYFDADYRSNLSATISMRHQTGPLRTNRILFVRLDPELAEGATLAAVLDAVDNARVDGYLVLTPDPSGPVGRSIISPPEHREELLDRVRISDHIRTTVQEHLTVLGCPKQVCGIPFIQQDGNLFTCSHAAAWMVHYAAVLRGLTARRSTVQFHSDVAVGSLIGRQYPSGGLTHWQIANVLEHFGLPVEAYGVLDIDSGGRFATWYDRPAIWALSQELLQFTGIGESHDFEDHIRAVEDIIDAKDRENEQSVERADRAQALLDVLSEFWFRETLTRTICRYLNSGFPSIVLTRNHATVLTGYLRRRDMRAQDVSSDMRHQTETDVVALFAADDQIGPYDLQFVDTLVSSFRSAEGFLSSLLIPLARGIWVSGNDAEELGAKVFAGSIPNFLKVVGSGDDKLYKAHVAEDIVQVVANELLKLQEELSSTAVERRDLAVRSYVVPASDFKQGFSRRRHADPVAVAQVRVANLPRYVWVVEVVRRALRHDHQACVLGEIVLDATDTDLRETNVHITHLPGAIRVRGTEGAGRWHITGVTSLYESGRYHGATDWATGPAATAARWKAAWA